jgi:hypothetical protein
MFMIAIQIPRCHAPVRRSRISSEIGIGGASIPVAHSNPEPGGNWIACKSAGDDTGH